MPACADVGKFHFTSSKARYFTMCGSTLFHVLRKQNISLYAFVYSNVVLIKKKGRGIFEILRPFPIGRYFDFYTALSQAPLGEPFYFTLQQRRRLRLFHFYFPQLYTSCHGKHPLQHFPQQPQRRCSESRLSAHPTRLRAAGLRSRQR